MCSKRARLTALGTGIILFLCEMGVADQASNTGYLFVEVPDDAVVYANGRLTRSMGARRKFVARNLQPGSRYGYKIRVIHNDNGQKLDMTKFAVVKGGETVVVSFSIKEMRTRIVAPTRAATTEPNGLEQSSNSPAGSTVKKPNDTALEADEKTNEIPRPEKTPPPVEQDQVGPLPERTYKLNPIVTYPRKWWGGFWREKIKFSPCGSFLAIGGRARTKPNHMGRYPMDGGNIVLWELKTGKRTVIDNAIPTPNTKTLPIAFTPDSSKLATGGEPGAAKIWDMTDLTAAPKIIVFDERDHNRSQSTALCFSLDGKRILISNWQTTGLFDANTGQEIEIHEDLKNVRLVANPKRIQRGYEVIERSQSGKLFALADRGPFFKILDLQKKQYPRSYFLKGTRSVLGFEQQRPDFQSLSLAQFVSQDEFMLVVGRKPFVNFALATTNSLSNGRQSDSIEIDLGGHHHPTAAVSEDGRIFAVKNARIEETQDFLDWQKQRQRFQDRVSLISIMRIDGGRFKLLGHVNLGPGWIGTMAVSPDGKTLVSSGPTLKFWDISSLVAGNESVGNTSPASGDALTHDERRRESDGSSNRKKSTLSITDTPIHPMVD